MGDQRVGATIPRRSRLAQRDKSCFGLRCAEGFLLFKLCPSFGRKGRKSRRLRNQVRATSLRSLSFAGKLRFRQWQWIPAFAGMTMPRRGALIIVIPAKAGIHHSRWRLGHGGKIVA